MTVLGVAGCTALLLIGFGLQDSLLPIVTKQSTELSHNDLTVTLSDPAAFTVEKGLTDALEKGQVENWAAVYSKSVTIYNADGKSAGVSVVGAQTDSQLSRYVTFRTRQGHKAIPFEKDSVVLTEKTALNLGVEPGDSIWVENPDGERVEMTLTGVTENYMFTRLYVSNAQLQTLLDTQDIPWNTVYAQTRCDSAADRNTMRETLLACNYVTGASFTEDATSMFDNLIVSLNSVVVLIIVCAAALAAVVLYNLISVNLAERKNELATIKVLGFYDKEVYRYIFREIDLLALMGSCVGLLLGIPCISSSSARWKWTSSCSSGPLPPQLPAERGTDHAVHAGSLLCHAAACEEDQHGGEHEGTGIRNVRVHKRFTDAQHFCRNSLVR